MIARPTRSHVLIAVGLLLLVAPAFAPLQPVLEHDTHRTEFQNETQLEAEGYRVVEYESLSERGKALYVETLQNGGTYAVAADEGASDFRYPTAGELGDLDNATAYRGLAYVVVERPPNASLPPADERVESAQHLVNRSEEAAVGEETVGRNMSVEEVRAQIARYDVMETRTTQPDLTAEPALLRFGAAMLGVVLTGAGGYVSSKP
ncbi:hypothetical protein G9C85_15555 [Halorubellus sp. JP-L1]|uniref:hypothetical protein n=1 Tax=Halorubellus sp. JP-L1 TaxID=2715753 RepID=UPI00140E82D2|nr:hypothetical protein [Halorubellus sp. JP-L1]NHN43034.1 hypothetical protein [Halorubellus sp. JP-L1]